LSQFSLPPSLSKIEPITGLFCLVVGIEGAVGSTGFCDVVFVFTEGTMGVLPPPVGAGVLLFEGGTIAGTVGGFPPPVGAGTFLLLGGGTMGGFLVPVGAGCELSLPLPSLSPLLNPRPNPAPATAAVAILPSFPGGPNPFL